MHPGHPSGGGGDLRDTPHWGWQPLGAGVPVAPQRHLVALGGDYFETGRLLGVLAPAAGDAGRASESPQPFTQHRFLSPPGPWKSAPLRVRPGPQGF